MADKPAWNTPQLRKIANDIDQSTLSSLLGDKGLDHLHVLYRGDHLVIYSEENGDRVPRARFTRIDPNSYQLGMADHRGKWDSTPFTGTLLELFTLLTDQFGFVLTDY